MYFSWLIRIKNSQHRSSYKFVLDRGECLALVFSDHSHSSESSQQLVQLWLQSSLQIVGSSRPALRIAALVDSETLIRIAVSILRFSDQISCFFTNLSKYSIVSEKKEHFFNLRVRLCVRNTSKTWRSRCISSSIFWYNNVV